MSDPKRYDMSWGKDDDDFIFVSPMESERGRWVRWEDYDRLKDKVEMLTPPLWLRVLAWILSFAGAFGLAMLLQNLLHR